MLVAGAGGHALEVLDILLKMGIPHDDILFFDNTSSTHIKVLDRYIIIKTVEDAQGYLRQHKYFCLGVGSPLVRYKLYNLMTELGGLLYPLRADGCWMSSHTSNINYADIFPFSIIGPKVTLGIGALVNARVNMHHEVSIGDFSEISPGAIILGNVSIGKFCQVGSGSIVLPKIRVGSNVIIGAGCVVTKDIPDNTLVVGVPGKPIKKLIPL